VERKKKHSPSTFKTGNLAEPPSGITSYTRNNPPAIRSASGIAPLGIQPSVQAASSPEGRHKPPPIQGLSWVQHRWVFSPRTTLRLHESEKQKYIQFWHTASVYTRMINNKF
jgi:hypothetical protein